MFAELLTVLCSAVLLSCNDSKMAGLPQSGQGKASAPQFPAQPPASTPQPISNVGSPPSMPQISAVPLPTAIPAVFPNETVGGMEVIPDCARCVERAKQLSPAAGFTADISRTTNMGFYKIEPSKNLCDIHFLRDLSTQIDDHEGKDSILNSQIALYCPCNCGWARNESENFGP